MRLSVHKLTLKSCIFSVIIIEKRDFGVEQHSNSCWHCEKTAKGEKMIMEHKDLKKCMNSEFT